MHRLGPYTLLTRIGVGGMAEIFLARRGDQIVALKRILPHLAANDEFVDMFVDEARMAARLRHPNIARVLDVGREQGLWYIAMEYVPGEDLLTIIRRSREKHLPTPLAVGATIIADAAAALHHAHDSRDEDGHPLGLVHRDVTPSNLIVSHEGHVKLVDFGIAKAERRVQVTQAGALKGKYAYMAPEHALGEALDRRADVFALGVVAWETFTQRRLFHREHELAVLRAVTEERIPIPSERRGDLPAELDEIIMRALDRDRETRWPTARHMEAALRRFVSSRLDGEPRHAIADLMDRLFGTTVAEKRRRWAAGDMDDEPGTNVEPFATPMPTQPRSRVPDLDEDAAVDEDATRVAVEPNDLTGRTEIDTRAIAPDGDVTDHHPVPPEHMDEDDDDDLDPQTTVVPLRQPRNGAQLSGRPDPTEREVRPSGSQVSPSPSPSSSSLAPAGTPSLPSSSRISPAPLRLPGESSGTPGRREAVGSAPRPAAPAAPRAVPPRVAPSRSAFPLDRREDFMTTEPVPKISGGPRYLRNTVIALTFAAVGVAGWLVLRPAARGTDETVDPAALPRLATHPEAGASVPAALEAPQLGTERKVVAPVARPGEDGPPVAGLTLEGPAGATITLDGEAIGTLPLAHRRLPAGAHTVTVVGPAREYSQTFALDLPAGVEHIELIRVDPESGQVMHNPIEPHGDPGGR
jgi:serine/threonine protein kinase